MGGTTRTFFAIEVPERLGRELLRVRTALSPELPGCRWATSTLFHMTLAFLGDVRDQDLDRLHEVVAAGVGDFEPCDLHVQGLGAFPSPGRPRVLWAGLSTRHPELLSGLQKTVSAAAAKAGYPCEQERFHPHVTLGRFKPGPRGPCDLTAIVERYRSWSCGDFEAEEIVGLASRLEGGRPSYEALSRARLEGKKSTPPP